jgi:hypothetical protein
MIDAPWSRKWQLERHNEDANDIRARVGGLRDTNLDDALN